MNNKEVLEKFKRLNQEWDEGREHSDEVWLENLQIANEAANEFDLTRVLTQGRNGVMCGDIVNLVHYGKTYDAIVEKVHNDNTVTVCDNWWAMTNGQGLSVSGGAFHRVRIADMTEWGVTSALLRVWGRNGSGAKQDIKYYMPVKKWFVYGECD